MYSPTCRKRADFLYTRCSGHASATQRVDPHVPRPRTTMQTGHTSALHIPVPASSPAYLHEMLLALSEAADRKMGDLPSSVASRLESDTRSASYLRISLNSCHVNTQLVARQALNFSPHDFFTFTCPQHVTQHSLQRAPIDNHGFNGRYMVGEW